MILLPVVFAVLYGYVIPMTQTRESTNYIITLCQIMNLAMTPIVCWHAGRGGEGKRTRRAR